MRLKEKILSRVGSVYPEHVKPLIEVLPEDILPLIQDLTANFQISPETTRRLIRLSADPEALISYLIVYRARLSVSGGGASIDLFYENVFRSLFGYLSTFLAKYLPRRREKLTREHLLKIADLGFGILQVLLDLWDRLPEEERKLIARKAIRLAEDFAARLKEV